MNTGVVLDVAEMCWNTYGCLMRNSNEEYTTMIAFIDLLEVKMPLKITVRDSNEAFGLKMEVDRHGLRPDAGYTWRYTPAVNDYFGATVLTPATVEFEFQDPQWATYFQLRWGAQ